jgi:Tfp pilus assembly protein PilP
MKTARHHTSPLALLLIAGLCAPVMAGAENPAPGPLGAIEPARKAADAASERAHEIDAETANVDPAPQPNAPAAADAPSAASAAGAPGADAAANPDTPGAAMPQPDNVVPIPELATEIASYEPTAHRDPFRPPSFGAPTASAEPSGPRTPLQRYEVGQLKLVGVIWDAGQARAMVEDSAGLGYIVTAGTPIGSSGGVVTRIEPRRIMIEESVTNVYGDKEPKQLVMELPEEDRSP